MSNSRKTAASAGPHVGPRLRLIRQRAGLSARALARRAGVTASMISCVETGRASPSIVTLEKLLGALGADFAAFFGAESPAPEGPVFPRETMRLAADGERSYTIVFPRRAGIGVEMMDEVIRPGRRKPAMATLPYDVGGCVLAGALWLELAGHAARQVRAGDAFYVPAGVRHRGWPAGSAPVRLITVCAPRGKSAEEEA